MIKDNIILGTEENKSFDKMEIALAIRNSTYEGELQCCLIENAVINSCLRGDQVLRLFFIKEFFQ